MSSARKRKNIIHESGARGKYVISDNDNGIAAPNGKHGEDGQDVYPKWLVVGSAVVGLVAMVYCGYVHSIYMWTIHENNLWFTNIKVCTWACVQESRPNHSARECQ
jgi:hypothetical protein